MKAAIRIIAIWPINSLEKVVHCNLTLDANYSVMTSKSITEARIVKSTTQSSS